MAQWLVTCLIAPVMTWACGPVSSAIADHGQGSVSRSSGVTTAMEAILLDER